MSHLVGGLVFGAFLVAAAIADVRTRTIPNALTATFAFIGLAMLVLNADPAATRSAWIAFGIALAVGIVMQVGRLMGGGDVKLFAASALWLGRETVDAALATALAGGVLAAFFLRRSRVGADTAGAAADAGPTGAARLQLDDGPDNDRVPYGVAIAVGCLWAWFGQSSLLFGP